MSEGMAGGASVEGSRFGHYELLSLLGRGGMGEVWRAHDTQTDRIVALKLLPPHLAGDASFQDRFRREARVAAALYEPHVVPIHDYGDIDGQLYVDMRLIVGRDLESILSEGPLEPARAVHIVEQVAAALQAAHQVGLIHRDVKPTNIRVTDTDFAYLIDFGIAHMAGEPGLTAMGSTIGTWAYMAPERFDDGAPDARVDTYALACVLYQCLTGRVPFPGDGAPLVAAHMSAPVPRASALNGKVPPALDDVIARGMAKQPDDRYRSTPELAAAARAALASGPVPGSKTTPIGAPLRQRRWAPPRRPHMPRLPGRRVPPVPPVAPQGPVAPATSLPYPPQGFSAPPGPVPPKKSRRGVIIAAVVAVVAVAIGTTLWITLRDKVDSDDQTIATQRSGPFDGTYTAKFGARKDFQGNDVAGVIADQTWVVRSTCDDDACVATASRVGGGDYVSDLVFDFVDGVWTAVDQGSENRCADNGSSPRWTVFTLEGDPATSMKGTYTVAQERGCDVTSSLTFTRAGDAESDADVPDPADEAPWVRSSALALHGQYDYESVSDRTGLQVEDLHFTVRTDCLRNGGRCLTFMSGDGRFLALTFANGRWSSSFSRDGECSNGASGPLTFDIDFALPQPVDDPIQRLRGTSYVRVSGSCPDTQGYALTLRRTGD